MLYYQRILYESKNGTTILYYSHVGVIIMFNGVLININIARKYYNDSFNKLYII